MIQLTFPYNAAILIFFLLMEICGRNVRGSEAGTSMINYERVSKVIAIKDQTHLDDVWENNTDGMKKLVVIQYYTKEALINFEYVQTNFERLSLKYPEAVFLKINIRTCQQIAHDHGVNREKLIFILHRDFQPLDSVVGPDFEELAFKIKKHYMGEDPDFPGCTNLIPYIDEDSSEYHHHLDLKNHTLRDFLQIGHNSHLVFNRLPKFITFFFTDPVNMKCIRIKAPANNGPQHVKVVGYDEDGIEFHQELFLTPKDLDGGVIKLRSERFANVDNLQLVINSNQNGDVETRIDNLAIIGSPV